MSVNPLSPEDILFFACQIKSASERRKYLDNICGEDTELRDALEAEAEVLPLIPGGFLEEPAFELLSQALVADFPEPDLVAELEGTMLGEYRVDRQIGEGGFALVFEAESATAKGDKVAVKVIKPGMDSREVLSRFRTERRLLARMNHPNIASIFEYGQSPNGRPYFVMELVDGVPITAYCDTKRLSVRDRVELFLGVCQAVHHAHQMTVIHRDLKPSNILVTECDSVPIIKVIDFGVAKALGPGFESLTLHSYASQIIGTPRYMSPEQAETGAISDTRSDIYSLGVVLYELITGQSPLGGRPGETANPRELLDQLRVVDAVRPTQRLQPSEQKLGQIAAERSTDPEKLRSAVGGDLEAILIKALQRDPSMRYQTVLDFTRDLEGFLHGAPVTAVPPNTWYHLKRFALRHRQSICVAAGVLCILCAATTVSTLMAVRATHANRLAAARLIEIEKANRIAVANEEMANAALTSERSARAEKAQQRQRALEAANREIAALKKAAAAREVSRVLSEYFLPQLAGQGSPSEITAQQMLANAVGIHVAEYPSQPLIQVAIRERVALSLRGISKYDAIAARHLERALVLRQQHQGESHVDTLNTEVLLAMTYCDLAKPDLAEPLFLHAIENRRTMLGDNDLQTLTPQMTLANAYNAQSRYVEARELLERVLNGCRSALGVDHEVTLHSEQALVATRQALGDLDGAETLCRDTLARHQRVLGSDNVLTLMCQSRLGDVLQVRRKYEEAGQLYEQTLESQRCLVGIDHAQTLVTELNLASVYVRLGRYTDAEALFLESLPKQQRVLGPENPATLKTQSNLASLYKAKEKFEKAEALFQSTFATMERSLGPDHSHTLVCRHKLAQLQHAQGKLNEAESLFHRCLESSRRLEGPEHRHTLAIETELAAVLRDQQRFAEAESLFSQALDRQRRTLGNTHESTLTTLHEFACLFDAQRKSAAAQTLFEEALAGRREVLGASHPDTLETEQALASLGP